MIVKIDVHASHSFSVEKEAPSVETAMMRLERDLSDQLRDPQNPLQSFTICSAQALSKAMKGVA